MAVNRYSDDRRTDINAYIFAALKKNHTFVPASLHHESLNQDKHIKLSLTN